MSNIAAVVVTYNRKKYLKICLDSLLGQGKLLSSIIIIDNNSSDGTEQMLKEDYLDNPIFDYTNMKSNLGGAGGFNYGIESAYQKGFEWIWMMDDDVAPAKNSLNKYLKLTNKSSFIQGRRAHTNGDYVDWLLDYNYKTGRFIKLSENQHFADKSFIEVNTACFEGAFINREIVDSIGLPNKEFFIQGDDTFYGVLASQKYKIIYTKEVLMIKTVRKPVKRYLKNNIELQTPFSIFYSVRNLFIIEKLLIESFPDENINHKYSILVSLVKTFIKIILIFPYKYKAIISLFKAIYAGLKV